MSYKKHLHENPISLDSYFYPSFKINNRKFRVINLLKKQNKKYTLLKDLKKKKNKDFHKNPISLDRFLLLSIRFESITKSSKR